MYMRRWNKYILIVFCFALLLAPYTAVCDMKGYETEQKEKRNISAQEWQELTNDDAFSYRDSIEFKKIEPVKEKPRTENTFIKAWRKFVKFLSSKEGQIIVWGLLFCIIAYAVYKTVIGDRSSLFGKTSKVQAAPDDADLDLDDITDTNWESLLHKAAKEGDLRMAVRYSYLLLLQILQEKDLIHYRNDKTNFQYAGELVDTPYKQTFRKLTRQYEYTWYGNFPISNETYSNHIDELLTLKKQVGK